MLEMEKRKGPERRERGKTSRTCVYVCVCERDGGTEGEGGL